VAKEDAHICEMRLVETEKELFRFLLRKNDNADSRNAILEIRPGTGGQEASLFAMEMFRMYQLYSIQKGWSFEILYVEMTDAGGCKEASAIIRGELVFGMLKYESGVHRVQRVPQTETSGRVHTSTMTVAILPEAEEIDVKISPKDLRVDTYRSSGAGGQHVNKTESAIRITHLPTGITVCIQDERSQFQNKEKAMKVLRSRLYDIERTKAMRERNAERCSQIGSGNRHERIRTYNFSQDRVTDHRTNTTVHNIENMMNGELLETFIDAMILLEENELVLHSDLLT